MSEFHFVRVFGELTGLSPLRFLSALRLAEARDLLISTDESVIRICLRVGYNSIGTFTRRFTDLIGISPLRLRQCARARRTPALGLQPLLVGAAVHVYVTSVLEAEPEPAGQALIAVFGTPLPFGRPVACALTGGGGVLLPSRLGLGRYYLLAFGLANRIRTCASPMPVTIADPVASHEVHVTLRRVEPTDPPLLSFEPFILYRQCFAG